MKKIIDIVHISDLHCGTKEFSEEFMLNVVDYINTNKPDVVINTGDITHKGKEVQYLEIKKYLDTIQVPQITVIGNHDRKKNGVIFFEQYIGNRFTRTEINDCVILGLNSSKDGTSEGEIGDSQMIRIFNDLKNCEKKIKIFALHHHLIDVPAAGVKRNTLIDGGDVLEIVRKFNVNLILMGHRHVPHVWNLNNTLLLYCGTSSSTKVRGRDEPSFNHIVIYDNEIIAHRVNSITLKKELLVHKKKDKIVEYEPRSMYLDHLWRDCDKEF